MRLFQSCPLCGNTGHAPGCPYDLTIWNCWLCYPGLCRERNDATHLADRAKQLEQMEGQEHV